MKNPFNSIESVDLKNKIQKTIISTGLILGIYHGIQFNYTKKQIADFLHEPKEFREFREHSGVKLRGFEEGIDKKEIVKIIQILNHEKLAKKQLSEIILESPNYYEKSNIGKISQTAGFHGLANPLTNTITLNDLSTQLFIHELAHIKTYAKTNILSEGEFLEKWDSIQLESKHKYYNINKKLTYFYSSITRDTTLNKKLELAKDSLGNAGFVTPYSQLNKYEDIAEIVEENLYNMYYNSNNIKKNDSKLLEQKINFLIEQDLLPKETREYINIKLSYINWAKIFDKSTNDSTVTELEKNVRTKYISDSEKFLNQNTTSFLYDRILLDQSTAIFTRYDTAELQLRIDNRKKLIDALNHPERIYYDEIIKKLEIVEKYKYVKNPEQNPYTLAIKEYNKKLSAFDMSITTQGVTDKLIELEILKK